MKGIGPAKGVSPAKANDDELLHEHVQKFKASLLQKLVPGLNAEVWEDSVYMVKNDTKSGRPLVMLRDHGFVELDQTAGLVRYWGGGDRAAALAAAIEATDPTRFSTVRAERRGTFSRGRKPGPRPGQPFVSDADDAPPKRKWNAQAVADWWRDQGYDPSIVFGSVWVPCGSAHLCDTGGRVEVNGHLDEEGARAMIVKAREQWSGSAEVTGFWTQRERDLLWLEAQRAGVELANCPPSQRAQARWAAEVEAAQKHERTLESVRGITTPAQTLRAAAGGDLGALAKLDPPLKAFVSAYLDDEQRQQLARADVADIAAELARFRALGAEELAAAQAPKDGLDDLDRQPDAAPAPDTSDRPREDDFRLEDLPPAFELGM